MLVKLREIINPALDSVTVDLKARDYEKAYRDGHTAGKKVEDAVKMYKSHRRVFNENISILNTLALNCYNLVLKLFFVILFYRSLVHASYFLPIDLLCNLLTET